MGGTEQEAKAVEEAESVTLTDAKRRTHATPGHAGPRRATPGHARPLGKPWVRSGGRGRGKPEREPFWWGPREGTEQADPDWLV